MVESLRKRWILGSLHQVAGGGATCYYQGDTTQRGIVQILIQGSIFIDGNAAMRAAVLCSGICHFRVPIPPFSGSAPLASSRSQLLREFIVRVGAREGKWELLGGLGACSHLTCATVAKARNVSIIYLGRGAPPGFLLID